jgi:hypothetical protein
VGGIDGDITKVGDEFHLSYLRVGWEGEIWRLEQNQRGYEFEPQRIDPETVATEAPNLLMRLGTNTYVHMYDVYGARPNNMGFSETTDFVTYKSLGHFN